MAVLLQDPQNWRGENPILTETEIDDIDHIVSNMIYEIMTPAPGDCEMGYPFNARLSLHNNDPIPFGNRISQDTLYLTPYLGDAMAYYDAVEGWLVDEFTQLSLDIGTLTASTNYDIFVEYDSGFALVSEAWPTLNTRTNPLDYQNGILVQSGEPTRRYAGSISVDSNQQLNLTLDNNGGTRFVQIDLWNMYNRVPTAFNIWESTDQWSASANVWEQWNKNPNNQAVIMQGIQGPVIEIVARSYMATGLTYIAVFGVGFNSGLVPNATAVRGPYGHADEYYIPFAAQGILGTNILRLLQFQPAVVNIWAGDFGTPSMYKIISYGKSEY